MKDTSLILEGGTFRTLFTAGVLDAFIDEKITMPYVVAISAGAINACSYISEQKERTLRVIRNYRHDKRYMGIGNFLKEKSYFGLDFAYNVLPNKLEIFDWDKYQAYNGKIEFGVTNAVTGDVEYLDALHMDKECMLLRATCAIPILFPEIKINDTPYYDGGLADPIPVQRAEQSGFEKHVFILTRPQGYRKKMDRKSKWVMKLLSRKYPALSNLMATRVERYNRTLSYVEGLEKEGRAFIFRPDYSLNSFEKNIGRMNETYQMGYDQTMKQLDAFTKFIQT
ncbi:patatin-like phospholipase family protein [Lysinibacillus sp. 54212]|uniref:patatin-like phospholipase family protein n=1 Tax=Lysinibacillus sp. 54212 TaxID=3119829 RepID=UPI002FC6402C